MYEYYSNVEAAQCEGGYVYMPIAVCVLLILQ